MKTLMIFATIFLISFMTMQVIGSAIPMWEFLSRKEKMSRLYRLFTQQVTLFCTDSSRPDCSKNFLVTGIRNLADIDDNTLDKLDPYQRGASEIIWRALIGTDIFSSRTSQDIKGTYFPTNEFLLIGNDNSETNNIIEESMLANDYIPVGPYLIGPMVTRVYPDGRPVPDNHNKFKPKDDDIDDTYTMVSPSTSDIETNFDKTAYRNEVLNNGRKDISSSRYIALRRISVKDNERNYH